MNPSVEPFDETKYKVLMDGLECSEIRFSQLDLGDRFDSDYYTKEYLSVAKKLESVSTIKLGRLGTTVASAFYPAATQLYSVGDTAFVRCVDCVSYPMITKNQDDRFEKIPLTFAKENKGISFIKTNDIVITKVGTPCYASIITDYDEVTLSRTVLGLTKIHSVNPFYLMIFLRCKYGFEQLYRQRELTIQYQLTLPRVKAIDVYIPSKLFQLKIEEICKKSREHQKESDRQYRSADGILQSLIKTEMPVEGSKISIKLIKESFIKTGRLDAEYYQPKYDALSDILSHFNCKPLGGDNGVVRIKKSIEPGSEAYQEDGIPFVRVSDVNTYEITQPEVFLAHNIVKDIESLYPQKDTILFSKDGSVGIAYKVEKDGQFVTSGALLHLTVRNTKEVLPDYLTLILNSPIVQLQAERDSNGAIIQHWKPSEIEQVVIPILDMPVQEIIAAKVQESFALRRKSKELLEYAKQAVEMAIEQGEEIALNWLNEKASL